MNMNELTYLRSILGVDVGDYRNSLQDEKEVICPMNKADKNTIKVKNPIMSRGNVLLASKKYLILDRKMYKKINKRIKKYM